MSAVKIDDDFVRFGSKSYAVSKITSIEVREYRPHDVRGAILFGCLAFVFLTLTVMAGAGMLILAAICGALAAFFWARSQYREYQLFLMTSSSEVQAFASQSEDEVLALQDKIEAAIVRRSRY